MSLELTKAEEKAMKNPWTLKRGLIRDVVAEYAEPRPAYTTVATIFKILEKKGFVGRKPIGNTHEYYPLLKREEYATRMMKSFVKNYYSNSAKKMVSEVTNREKLSAEEIDDLIKHFQSKRNNQGKHWWKNIYSNLVGSK